MGPGDTPDEPVNADPIKGFLSSDIYTTEGRRIGLFSNAPWPQPVKEAVATGEAILRLQRRATQPQKGPLYRDNVLCLPAGFFNCCICVIP